MSQNDNTILEAPNMTIKGDLLITMATSHNKKTSNSSRKARFDVKTIEEIQREAKKLIFFNSAKYLTATKNAKQILTPEEMILFRNQSKNLNHPHAVKVLIHEQK